MTTIFFLRHSKSNNHSNNNLSLQMQNEKWKLSNEGKKLALEKSKNKEYQNFDVVYSSHYTRAVETAKFFSKNIIIEESFGERKFGIDNWDELPKDFEKKQLEDYNYKVGNGESLKEVLEREEKALGNILLSHKNKKILIVGHATALMVLFSKWCDIRNNGNYCFNGKTFFDGDWHPCELFKTEFDETGNLIMIENIR